MAKLLYGEFTQFPAIRDAYAKRFAYLLEHHLEDLLRLFPTCDTCDSGVEFAIDEKIKEYEHDK